MPEREENVRYGRFDLTGLARKMDDDALSQGRRLGELLEFDASMRGTFIIQSITIESSIDRIVMHQFALEDENLFMSLILKNLQFSKKIKIVDALLKLGYPSFKKKYPKLIKRLEEIAILRNKLAHAESVDFGNIMPSPGDEKMTLSYYEGEKKKSLILKASDIKAKALEGSEILGILDRIDTKISRPSSRVRDEICKSLNLF